MVAQTATLSFTPSPETIIRDAETTIIVGRHCQLQKFLLDNPNALISHVGFTPPPEILKCMHASLEGSSVTGSSTSSYIAVPGRSPHKLALCALKDKVSRNNHPLSLHALPDLIKGECPGNKGCVHVIVLVEDIFGVGPVAGAVARAFPLFSKKTTARTTKHTNGDKGGKAIHTTFVDGEGKAICDEMQIKAAEATADGVRLACRLVDTHPEELTTTAFAAECRNLFANEKAVTIEEIVGEELKERGYGGLYSVGKAADEPPRLLILSYNPPADLLEVAGTAHLPSVALVGKGIVYDCGGLALKSKVGMCSMKGDMGGSAGVLGGFLAAVKLATPRKIRLLLCLAENAIGPRAFRNDDILTMYSGKTVEVNNTDAEGRLVLADGVAHATKHYEDVGLVVTMATLTGAQSVSTGQRHAAILANTVELENRAVGVGLASGDLCFPVLYAPDLLMEEFKSKVADMKNSVKDRSNAQASCAGHFIQSHLHEQYEGEWLHVDMAGPAKKNERATGYGVGLVMSLVKAPGFDERL